MVEEDECFDGLLSISSFDWYPFGHQSNFAKRTRVFAGWCDDSGVCDAFCRLLLPWRILLSPRLVVCTILAAAFAGQMHRL
jgi:hypothetical protein